MREMREERKERRERRDERVERVEERDERVEEREETGEERDELKEGAEREEREKGEMEREERKLQCLSCVVCIDVVYPLGALIAWTVFALIHFLAGFRNEDGCMCIYKEMNWHTNPGQATLAVFAGLLRMLPILVSIPLSVLYLYYSPCLFPYVLSAHTTVFVTSGSYLSAFSLASAFLFGDIQIFFKLSVFVSLLTISSSLF